MQITPHPHNVATPLCLQRNSIVRVRLLWMRGASLYAVASSARMQRDCSYPPRRIHHLSVALSPIISSRCLVRSSRTSRVFCTFSRPSHLTAAVAPRTPRRFPTAPPHDSALPVALSYPSADLVPCVSCLFGQRDGHCHTQRKVEVAIHDPWPIVLKKVAYDFTPIHPDLSFRVCWRKSVDSG